MRLWMEATHMQGLRARISQSLDAATGEEPVAVAASADEICKVVKRWVEDFESPSSASGGRSAGDGAVTHASHDGIQRNGGT